MGFAEGSFVRNVGWFGGGVGRVDGAWARVGLLGSHAGLCDSRSPRRMGWTMGLNMRRLRTGEQVKMVPKPPPPEGETRALKELVNMHVKSFMSAAYVWVYILKKKRGTVLELSTAHKSLAPELKDWGSQRDDHACKRLGEEIGKLAVENGIDEVYFYHVTIKSSKMRRACHSKVLKILEGMVKQGVTVCLDAEDYRQRHQIGKAWWPEVREEIAAFGEKFPDKARVVNLGVNPDDMVPTFGGRPNLGVNRMNGVHGSEGFDDDEEEEEEEEENEEASLAHPTHQKSTFTGSFTALSGVPIVPVNKRDYFGDDGDSSRNAY